MARFVLGGTVMPMPSVLTIKPEKIWSKNAGRTSTGKFVGDVIAIKHTLHAEWKTLSQSQGSTLYNLCDGDFVTVTYVDPKSSSGAEKTITCYVDGPSYNVYSYVDGYPRYTGVAIDLVEQ